MRPGSLHFILLSTNGQSIQYNTIDICMATSFDITCSCADEVFWCWSAHRTVRVKQAMKKNPFLCHYVGQQCLTLRTAVGSRGYWHPSDLFRNLSQRASVQRGGLCRGGLLLQWEKSHSCECYLPPNYTNHVFSLRNVMKAIVLQSICVWESEGAPPGQVPPPTAQ